MSKLSIFINYPKSKKKLKQQKQQQLRKEKTELELTARKAKEEEKECPLFILKNDIAKARKALAESVSVRERWRKTEESTLNSASRFCTELKKRIASISCYDSDTSVKLTGVYREFSDLVVDITNSYSDISAIIFEDEESTKKYYSKGVLEILELWGCCSQITVDLMVPLIQVYRDSCDEHVDLAKAVSNACSGCVKLLILSINTKDNPVPDGLGEKVARTASDQSRRNADSITKLAQAGFQTSLRNADDYILEMMEWLMYGLDHVTVSVVKPTLEATTEEPAAGDEKQDEEKKEKKGNGNGESIQNLNGALNTLFDALSSFKQELGNSYHIKSEEAENEATQQPFSDCLLAISHLEKVYKDLSETIISSGKVTVCQEDPNGSDATIFFRPELYAELAKISIGPCDMGDRNKWLSEIPLTCSDQLTRDDQIISDIYIVRNGPLKTSCEVEVDFTLVPLPSCKDKKILLKVKSDGEWKDIEDIQQEISEKDAHISFKTCNLEAFVAYVEIHSDVIEVTPEGYTYTSETNGDIQVIFPEGIVQEPQKFNIKVIPYDHQEVQTLKDNFPDAILGIVAVSDTVEISGNGADTMKKTTIHLPLDDDDDPDSHLVVIRYNDQKVQVLDKSQCHIKKEKNMVKIEGLGVWSYAVAKIRKIFLNMRDSIKREFLLMFGKVQLCSICTFIDDTQRDMEEGTFYFWIECIDKYRLQEDIEIKKKAGLIEIQSSRSKDIALRQNETITLTIDGQVRIHDPDPPEKFQITYLIGADNHLNIPLEVHRDNDSIPYASLTFTESDSDKFLHCVNVPVRDLSELPSDEITARQISKANESNSLREEMRKKEEAANKVLSHESLMALARELSENDAENLGLQLGVDEDVIRKFKDSYEGDTVQINFLILCEWRGKTPRATMVDFLVSSLKTTGNTELSSLVDKVRNKGRSLVKEDFK